MSQTEYTSVDDFPEILQTLRKTFKSGKTAEVSFRKQQLQRVVDLYVENKELILKSLHHDLGKPRFEGQVNEIETVISAANDAIANLDKWMKPTKVEKHVTTMLDETFTVPEPFGVALVIGPWNYPSFCTMVPVIGAIAAGNCVVIKPSENASATATFFKQLIPQYLDKECYRVVHCGGNETAELLQNKFDYIFFTGGTGIGQKVYEAAAKHLTPVTLELGGKSPVYIDDTLSDYKTAMKRILWGKCLNSGQTCVAPDYVLCSERVKEKIAEYSKEILKEFYGENNNNNEDFGRIVNSNHFQRLERVLSATKGSVVSGGNRDSSTRYFEPTIVVDVTPEDSLMQEELFGPILPVVTVKDTKEAIEIINSREKPLVIYLFSENRKLADRFIKETSSGALVANETVIHLAATALPFGGVGSSGLGCYLGKHTFDTFSHKKSVLIHGYSSVMEAVASVRYPPYNEYNAQLLASLVSKSNGLLPNNAMLILSGTTWILLDHLLSFIKKTLRL